MFDRIRKKGKNLSGNNINEGKQKFLSKSLKINIKYIEEIGNNMSDLIFRDVKGLPNKSVLIFLKNITDNDKLNQNVIKPISKIIDNKSLSLEELITKTITVSNYKSVDNMDDLFGNLMKGQSILIVDGLATAYALATEKHPGRQVEEPTTETIIRGSKEGFIENININMGLIRNICRDPNLKFETLQIGRRTKTDVVVAYVTGITNSDYIEEVKNRLTRIDIDRILDSGEIAPYLNDNNRTPFPQVSSTERLDAFIAGLLDGRVGILVGNSPFGLIVPCSLHILLSSPEDFYENWIISSVIRLIRYLAFLLSIILPATYVALISFNVGLLPKELVFTIGATRSEFHSLHLLKSY